MKFISLSLIALFLAGCSFSGTRSDSTIDGKTSIEIARLNAIVVKAVRTKDGSLLNDIISDSLRKPGTVDSFFRQATWDLEKDSFVVNHTFLTSSSAAKKSTSVTTGSGDHDYTISYKTFTEESFVSIGHFEGPIQNILLLSLYGKYDGKWKLNVLRLGVMEIYNRDAIDLYRSAQTAYSKGRLVNAVLNNSIGAKLLKPADNYWTYQLEKEVKAFGTKLDSQVSNTYHFPYTLEKVSTSPQVFRVVMHLADKAMYPSVYYVTSLPMSDTTKLSKECDEINAHINEAFQDLAKDQAYMYYKACDKLPNGIVEPETIGFIRKLINK